MKRSLSLLALAALLLAPAAAQAQLAIFGGQQTWTYEGGSTYTGTGAGVGLRTGILPIFDLAVDASYYAFPDEKEGESEMKVSTLNYTASAILGGKKERVNLYAGIGQYNLRRGSTTTSPIGLHGGVMLHLFGALSADARVVLLKTDDGRVSQETSTRIIPISLRLQF